MYYLTPKVKKAYIQYKGSPPHHSKDDTPEETMERVVRWATTEWTLEEMKELLASNDQWLDDDLKEELFATYPELKSK